MHLPILHRHRNRTDEKTWQQAWARALDLMENPFSHKLLIEFVSTDYVMKMKRKYW